MKRLFVFLSLIFVISSCSEPVGLNNNQTESSTSFYGLKIGNSWEYKYYTLIISTNEYQESGIIDSVSIVGTENILGETYFKFKTVTTGNTSNPIINSNGESFEFLREVNGNLIDETGKLKFTNNNFEERLIEEASFGNIFEMLKDEEITLIVEAGSFNCIYSEIYARNPQGELFDGLDKYYYSEGIGLISNTISFVSSSTPRIIKRLNSFSIQ